MSRGDLQEMEQSKTACECETWVPVILYASLPAKVDGQSGSYEDLGGPTPENYKPRR